MQNTVPAGEGAMCAVMALDAAEDRRSHCRHGRCDGSQIITVRDRLLLRANKNSVEKAAEKLKEAGAKRTILLNVSGPFHSPMLKPAGEGSWKKN